MGIARRVHDTEASAEPGDRIIDVPVDQIDPSPYQVRVDFDGEELESLAADISHNGLTQPITLRRKRDGRYELVAGERRCRAFQSAGLATIEARVRDLDDFAAHLIGVSENNQRSNLSPWEKSLETMQLQQHAKATGRPHAQRDLARYLNRNVAIVNQQLAIADALTVDLLAHADVSTRDACRLPHDALHRVASLTPDDRTRALRELVHGHRVTETGGPEPTAPNPPSARQETVLDAWTRFWERGGFQVHIRKPISALDPAKAQKYLDVILPAVAGLAERASETNGDSGVLQWEHGQGRLLFLRPFRELTPEQRDAAREGLARLMADLEAGS
jgi:ParB/RepB/Spo0J family partition protein